MRGERKGDMSKNADGPAVNEWAVGFIVPGWGEHDVIVSASSIDEAIDLGLLEAGLDKDEVTVAYVNETT